MISKFTTVYAGHVDLPDRGQDTTPANERRYSNEHLASVFEKTEAIAKKMDALGYDTLWLAEHHFQHEGYECIPNILMLAVHLAHVTKRLKIGCGFNIVPMWHPLRLAEDFAAADILTGAGLPAARVNKVRDGRPHIVDHMLSGGVQLVFNTTEGNQAIADSFSLRRTALTHAIPYYTTVAGARAAVQAIAALRAGSLEVAPLQSYF